MWTRFRRRSSVARAASRQVICARLQGSHTRLAHESPSQLRPKPCYKSGLEQLKLPRRWGSHSPAQNSAAADMGATPSSCVCAEERGGDLGALIRRAHARATPSIPLLRSLLPLIFPQRSLGRRAAGSHAFGLSSSRQPMPLCSLLVQGLAFTRYQFQILCWMRQSCRRGRFGVRIVDRPQLYSQGVTNLGGCRSPAAAVSEHRSLVAYLTC